MGNKIDHHKNQQLMKSNCSYQEDMDKNQTIYEIQDIVFPLSTSNMMIVDSKNRRVKLAGANWSGAHMCRHCVDGLQCRPLKDIAKDLRFKFGFNCIRLTYSLQLYYENNVIPQKYIKANPEFKGLKALQIFDKTIQILTQVGLMVILNNHTSSSMWCCSNDDGDGLWWSRQYPQYKFFEVTGQFAKRYQHNQRVIGIDLRNQIRKAHGLEPTWGGNDPKTDWRRAAIISGQIALNYAPHWLIFVGGLKYQLNLTDIFKYPIKYSIPNKLVYSGHFYSWSWPLFKVMTYEQFKIQLFNTQTYVRALGYPYLLGQFGNNQQDKYWQYMIRYMKETNIDWTYWALDGFKCDPDKDETFGIFTNDFKQARHPKMLADLQTVILPDKQEKDGGGKEGFMNKLRSRFKF